MRFRRFEIAGDSMLPTLTPGDYVLADRDAVIRPSHIVALQHPEQPGFWLVKRVLALEGVVDLDEGTVDGEPFEDEFRTSSEQGRFEIPHGSMFVASDNRSATRSDSRSFGAVPTESAYRVRLRYWPSARCF